MVQHINNGCHCCKGGIYSPTWPRFSSCVNVQTRVTLAAVFSWLKDDLFNICGRSRSACIMHFFKLILLHAFFFLFFVSSVRNKLCNSSPMRPRAFFMNTLRHVLLFLKFSFSSIPRFGSFANIRCNAECALLHGLHRTEHVLSLPDRGNLRNMVHCGIRLFNAAVTQQNGLHLDRSVGCISYCTFNDDNGADPGPLFAIFFAYWTFLLLHLCMCS